jgi:hypothetical protein
LKSISVKVNDFIDYERYEFVKEWKVKIEKLKMKSEKWKVRSLFGYNTI